MWPGPSRLQACAPPLPSPRRRGAPCRRCPAATTGASFADRFRDDYMSAETARSALPTAKVWQLNIGTCALGSHLVEEAEGEPRGLDGGDLGVDVEEATDELRVAKRPVAVLPLPTTQQHRPSRKDVINIGTIQYLRQTSTTTTPRCSAPDRRFRAPVSRTFRSDFNILQVNMTAKQQGQIT